MKYFSMFSGVGGFELGINRAYNNRGLSASCAEDIQEHSPVSAGVFRDGWRTCPTCIGFSEIDKHAIRCYNEHFPNHINYGNARDIDTDKLPDFELLVGGFPCQAFSVAGKRGGFSDTRGTLFFEIARIAQVKKPRLMVLENVKGLLSHDEGKTFATILSTIDELGYEYQFGVVNSRYFGVPQNRERVFIVCNLRGTPRPEVFPIRRENTTDTKQVASTAIDANYGKGIDDHGARTGIMTHPILTPDRLDKRQNGRRIKNDGEPSFTLTSQDVHGIITHCLQPRSPDRPSLKYSSGGSGHLWKDDGTAYCVDTGNTQAIQLDAKIRRLTPTECERLQGFPKNWTAMLSDSQRYKTMGNAVTVNVVQAIMERIFQEVKQ
jgi:DNA (cytosine-5)-methyltransferase 1